MPIQEWEDHWADGLFAHHNNSHVVERILNGDLKSYKLTIGWSTKEFIDTFSTEEIKQFFEDFFFNNKNTEQIFTFNVENEEIKQLIDTYFLECT